MGTVDKAAIAAALNQRFNDKISSALSRTALLAQIQTVKNARSSVAQWVAQFGNAVGTAYTDGAAVSTFNNDTKLPALLQFGVMHDGFKLTGLARAVASAAGNPAELADLFLDELTDSITRQAKGISQQLYLGTGAAGPPQQIHGLTPASGVAALGDTGIYATIDRAVQTQWQANVIDATTFNPANPSGSFKYKDAAEEVSDGVRMMRQMTTDIYTASQTPYDLIVCTPAVHQSYGLSIGEKRRFESNVQTGRGMIKLDSGYQMLEFDGIHVVQDPDCPAGEMLFLNTQEMEILQLPSPADKINRATGTVQLKGQRDQFLGENRTNLSARVQPLAQDGDASPFALFSYLQQCVKSPNRFGRITGLTA